MPLKSYVYTLASDMCALVWRGERDHASRMRWCQPPTYCPKKLTAFLKSTVQGSTAFLHRDVTSESAITLTVLGGAQERLFAQNTLSPIIVRLVKHLKRSGMSTQVHVTYCNACDARFLPSVRGARLTSDHVNGGMCMGEDMGILVFRKQDAVKVLVHELLHLFNKDSPMRNLPKHIESTVVRSCKGLWRDRKGGVPVGLNEAYTDAIACLMFCGDVDRARTHAVHMATKVLAHFRFGELPFLESTHAFSYYVVKAAILVRAGDFIRLITDRTFPLDPSVMLMFMDDCLHSEEFKTYIQIESSHVSISRSKNMGIEMTDGKPNKILKQVLI